MALFISEMLKCSLALLSFSDMSELGDSGGLPASPTVRDETLRGGREASFQACQAISAIPAAPFVVSPGCVCGMWFADKRWSIGEELGCPC